MTRPSGERLVGVDLLRVAGVLAIVGSHVWGSPLSVAALATWNGPLFFVLSGYCSHRGTSLTATARARVRTLLVPYLTGLVLVAMIAIPYFTIIGQPGPWLRGLLARMVIGGAYLQLPFNAFWFITALFWATLLHQLLLRVPLAVRILLLAGVAAVVATFAADLPLVPLSLGLALPAVLLMEAGRVTRLAAPRLPTAVLAVATAVPVGLIVGGLYGMVDIKNGRFGPWGLFLLCATVLTCAVTALACRVPWGDRGAAVARALTPLALPVVLLHGIGVLWQPTGWATLLQYLAMIIVPVAVALALRGTVAGAWLTGHASYGPRPPSVPRRDPTPPTTPLPTVPALPREESGR